MEILRELLENCSDVSLYKDVQGSTLLHTASGRGQIKVVKFLLESFELIHSTDNQGNTALHVAAYRGYLHVVEVLISASPSSISLANNYGDTFFHMAVAGFRTPGFRRVDRQIELMKQLVSGKIVNLEDIINVKNNDGRTALHLAVIENVHSDLVELLMTVPLINLNIRDVDRMTPLDLLKQRPQSASSEILIKRLISAGGISNYQDYMTRTALASHLKTHGIGGSPGTSFRVPDAEIIFYTGVENDNENASCASYDYDTCSGELSRFGSPARSTRSTSGDSRKLGSINSAARRLRILLGWARRKDEVDNGDFTESYSVREGLEYSPVPLRQRFSKCTSHLPNNRRIFAMKSELFPSPSTKKKFSAGLSHGVLQVGIDSPSSPLSESSWSSPISTDIQKAGDPRKDIDPSSNRSFKREKSKLNHQRQTSLNSKLMNEYFCFGAQGLAVEDSVSSSRQQHRSSKLQVLN